MNVSSESAQSLQLALRGRCGSSSAKADASPREASELLHSGGHDAIVTDLQLPAMSGFELVDLARVRAPGTPAMILTAARAGDVQAVFRRRSGRPRRRPGPRSGAADLRAA